MIIILILAGTLLQLCMFLFPASYMSELLISFLPYGIVMSFLIAMISLVHIVSSYKKNNTVSTVLWMTLSTLRIGSTIFYSLHYRQQYYTSSSLPTSTVSDGPSFLYANVYYKNDNFSGLISTIQSHHPDIVLLVEYSKIHDESLSPLLKEEYPYVSRYVGGKGYDGDVIYSRYPLKKIKQKVYPGSFSHVTITYQNKDYDFALIHTSAPVSQHFFTMRNEQLSDLEALITKYYTGGNEKNIILLGDFNITPRSYYYTPFDAKMKTVGLYDVTNNNISKIYYNSFFPYTRCHQDAPYVCSHIDHIWTNIKNISLQKITIPGSDHDGFIGQL